MSETGKKRSRKDKQVVRECVDFDEGKNHNMQNVLQIHPKVKIENDMEMVKQSEEQLLIDIANIKKEIHESGYEENPHMKFSVRVEVEECNEDIRHNIKIEIHNLEHLNQPATSNAQSNNDSDSNDGMSAENVKVAEIDLKKLYDEVDEIASTSTNPADKVLARELKNNWGTVLRLTQYDNPLNNKIQQGINKWKLWATTSKYRDAPMFYKCYICKKAWWHLEPFRSHLLIHHVDRYRIDMEEHLHEANIIAYNTVDLPENIYIKADGECWKCDRPFEHHMSTEKKFPTYFCKSCVERFYICADLRVHETECWRYLKYLQVERSQLKITCDLCARKFITNKDLDKHRSTRHLVRSDLPIPSQFKICATCNLRYFVHSLHFCPKKLPNFNCKMCNRGFSSKLLMDIHTVMTESDVYCQICSMKLTKKCMEMLHYQIHTDMFRLAYKCAVCTNMKVYIDEYSAKYHREVEHKLKYDRRRNYFERVLLPISYFPDGEMDKKVKKVIRPVIEHRDERDFPVFEARDGTKTYQSKVKVEPDDPVLTEIKQEIDDDTEVYTGCHEYGAETFVFQEEPMGEELMMPVEAIKMDIKSEPIDEEYEDDIIRLSIDTPEDTPIKEEPQEPTAEPETECKEVVIAQDEFLSRLRRQSRNTQGRYTCSRCNRNFLTAKKYILHFTTHGLKRLACPKCQELFPTMTSLIPHLSNHVKQSYLKLRVIDTMAELKKHKLGRSKGKYQCKLCKSKVEHEHLYSHWDTHLKVGREEGEDDGNDVMSLRSEGLKLVLEMLVASKKDMKTKDCVICHRHFERKNDCKRHLIEHLLTDAYCNKPAYGSLKCQICHMAFQKADRYKLHMRDHGSLPVYRCELCDRAFSDSSNFTKHKKVHNLQVVICDICSKKFQAKSSLLKHLELHRTTKPIVCNLCSRVSYTESAYKKHVRRYHDRVEAKFKCQYCGKRYVTLKEKWDHLWIVHKERTHKADCPICKKGFRRYMDVKSHMIQEHSITPARRPRKNEDIEEFLRVNPTLELPESETLIVYE